MWSDLFDLFAFSPFIFIAIGALTAIFTKHIFRAIIFITIALAIFAITNGIEKQWLLVWFGSALIFSILVIVYKTRKPVTRADFMGMKSS